LSIFHGGVDVWTNIVVVYVVMFTILKGVKREKTQHLEQHLKNFQTFGHVLRVEREKFDSELLKDHK
jgi:hypothetical protein